MGCSEMGVLSRNLLGINPWTLEPDTTKQTDGSSRSIDRCFSCGKHKYHWQRVIKKGRKGVEIGLNRLCNEHQINSYIKVAVG